VPVPTVTLNNGVQIPQLGYGVFQIPPDETEKHVSEALEAGYRHIDTAKVYGNETGVRKAIDSSGIKREELFVTTKLWNSDQGKSTAVPAFEKSLSKLGLEQLDLYLIHWPMPAKAEWINTYLALQDGPYANGQVRALGVSNFSHAHLRKLLLATDVKPAVNQIELHPRFPQDEARAFHAEHEIVTEAWSPIGQGQGLLEDPVLATIGKAYDKSPAQVVLRWHVQLGNVVIPKSVTPSRIAENIDVFDFELSTDDMAQVSGMSPTDGTGRLGPDPDTFEIE